jgi:hypothetical protein
MGKVSILARSPQAAQRDRGRETPTAAAPTLALGACLELLLQAFEDIADRDDIHQAAGRLRAVLRWIDGEKVRVTGDAIFSPTSTCPPRRRRPLSGFKDEPQVLRSL